MSLKRLHQKKKAAIEPLLENITILRRNKMKDSSKLNQYCCIHKYVHKEAYELCDYCLEHKHYLYHRDKYCNYGFSKRNIAICKGCEDGLFGGSGKYRIIIADEPYDMYERICEVIKDKTTTTTMKGEGKQQKTTIEYFEAVRIVYLKDTQYFIEYFGCDDKGDLTYDEINKNFRGLWRLTFRFVNEEQRIKVVNRDPNNLLVSWVPGCYTGFDIPKKVCWSNFMLFAKIAISKDSIQYNGRRKIVKSTNAVN
jgi:hypothetical protein